MLNRKASSVLIAVTFCLVPALTISLICAQSGDTGMLAHNVYFSLKDTSDTARAGLADACHKYLKGHPGQVFFAAGILAGDMNREVNDRGFDVSLHIVFKTRADHDRYQAHEKHKKFIDENQANWARVRVFDSYVK
jgi:hypothetical protein